MLVDIQRLIMKPTPKRFAIFILGAGFSRPAGLPVATELGQEVRRRAEDLHGRASGLGRDLNDYIEFRRRCDGIHLETAEIDFEDFLGFLDTEFYLGLRGSDNWSEEGNETQLLVKRLIGQILMERTPSMTSLGIMYLQFAERLQPGDLVLTFNYDILLERALEAVGKPFRLFPQRFTAIHGSNAEVDSSRDEVVVLKLHGSANWFDRKQYRLRCEAMTRFAITDAPKDLIFNGLGVRLQPIVEGPRFPALRDISRGLPLFASRHSRSLKIGTVCTVLVHTSTVISPKPPSSSSISCSRTRFSLSPAASSTLDA